MTYSIVYKGVAVENFVLPDQLHRALQWWKQFGMQGEYTYAKEPRNRAAEITLAKFPSK